MTRPKERLQNIIDEYGLRSVARLARDLGLLTSSSIWDIFKKDPDQFSLVMIHRLKNNFPELNPDWVKTGSGEMFIGGFSPRQDNRGGHHNRNVQNNIHTSGHEKIINPDGTVSIEPTGPQAGTGNSATDLKRENDALRRENAELRGELKAKSEMIEQLLATIKSKR